MLENQVGDADKLSLSEYMASQASQMSEDRDAERIAENEIVSIFLSKKVFSEIELVSQNLVFDVDELDFTLSDILNGFKRPSMQPSFSGGNDLTTNVSSMTPAPAGTGQVMTSPGPSMPPAFSSLQSVVQSLSQAASGGQRSYSSQPMGLAGGMGSSGGYTPRSVAPQMPSVTPMSASPMTPGAQPQGMTPQGGQVSMPSGDDASIMAMIEKHEGKREKPYRDSRGLWTVGVGHLIGPTLPPEWNKIFTDQEINQLFAKDYAEHKAAAERIPGFEKLNANGKGAVIDLTFNMGPAWYKKFPAASAALAKGDMQTFANEMQNSAWFRQVGNRGPTIVAMIRSGGGDATQQAQQVPGTPSTGPQLSQAGATTEAADQAQMRSAGQQISSLAAPTPPPMNQPTPSTITPSGGEVPINVRLQNLQA